jgi:F-type H+-transporting ATPase subunit b
MHAAFLSSILVPAPQSPEPQLIDVDATLYVQLGIFLVLVFVLGRLLWRPYLRVRAERVTRIEGYREEATTLEAEAAARLERAEQALAEARRVGSGERAVARAEAQAREQTVLAEATASAQRMVAEARARLDASVEAERAKIRSNAAEIGLEAARQILGREVAR